MPLTCTESSRISNRPSSLSCLCNHPCCHQRLCPLSKPRATFQIPAHAVFVNTTPARSFLYM